MLRRSLTRPRLVPVLLCLQIVPLLLFPPASYSFKTQEWWLPALLSFFTLLALLQILVRRSQTAWPWHILGFSQGLNIISRAMMLMPHAYVFVGEVQTLNLPYVILTFVSVLLSAGALWHSGLPEVRVAIQPKKRTIEGTARAT
jgi:hypothetical protein